MNPYPIEWSSDVAIPVEDGIISVFQQATFAVRLEDKIRVLPKGAAAVAPEAPSSYAFNRAYFELLSEQQEALVVEEDMERVRRIRNAIGGANADTVRPNQGTPRRA